MFIYIYLTNNMIFGVCVKMGYNYLPHIWKEQPSQCGLPFNVVELSGPPTPGKVVYH